MANAKILIVQNDHSAATHLEERLKGTAFHIHPRIKARSASAHLEERLIDLGYTVCATVSHGQQAIEKAAETHPDLALIDLGLKGDVDGVAVGEQLGSRMPVIYLMDEEEEYLLHRAEATQPFGYVLKPVDERQLHFNIKTALSLRERENKYKEIESKLQQQTQLQENIFNSSESVEMDAELSEIIDELRHQTQFIEALCDTIDNGIIVVDLQGQISFINSTTERVFGQWFADSETDDWSKTYGIFYSDTKTPVPVEQFPLTRAIMGEKTEEMKFFVQNKKTLEGKYISARGLPIRSKVTDKVIAGLVVFRDLTKEKETEEKLEQTIDELRYQTHLMETVFDSISDGVMAADENGKYFMFNSSAERIGNHEIPDIALDQRPEEYGLFYLDKKTLFPADELPLARAIRGESTDDIEMFMRNRARPEGMYISVSGRPLQSRNGVKGGVVVFHDITRLKQTEAELKRTIGKLQDQTQLMETIFESMSDAVVATDENGRYLFSNSAAIEISGSSRPSKRMNRWAAIYGIYYPDKKTPYPTDELPLVRAIRGEKTDNVEIFLRNKAKPDGVHLSVSSRPLVSEKGTLRGGVIVVRDNTRYKETQIELQRTIEKLQKQTHLMKTVFDSLSEGVIAADENGQFTIFNPTAERIVGIGTLDLPPDQWSNRYGVFFPDKKTRVPTSELPLVRTLQGESIDDMALFIRNEQKPDGVYISVSGRPLESDIDKNREGGVVVFRDITKQMIAEEALMRAFAQGRLEIVDTILHNIGNAINSVTVGIETVHQNLADDPLLRRFCALADAIQAHRDDWGDYISHNAQGQKVMPFILALAEDFTRQKEELAKTVARVKSRADHIADIIRTQKALGSLNMERKDIDLQNAFSAAIRVLQDSLDKRGIVMDVDCKNAPQEIRIQESQFHQMMVNLIKNSIEAIDDLAASGTLKETPRIQIRAYTEREFLYLDVIDNGIGIEQKNLKMLFSAGYTTKKLGNGLGLHSAANFVIGSGGQIHPLSDGIGKGATMRVMLRCSSIISSREGEH